MASEAPSPARAPTSVPAAPPLLQLRRHLGARLGVKDANDEDFEVAVSQMKDGLYLRSLAEAAASTSGSARAAAPTATLGAGIASALSFQDNYARLVCIDW